MLLVTGYCTVPLLTKKLPILLKRKKLKTTALLPFFFFQTDLSFKNKADTLSLPQI